MKTLEQLKTGKLIGIKTLSLECGLDEFPEEIFDLAETLEVLNMTNNKLNTLPDDFGRLKNLKILFLSNNQFEEVPKVLSECPQLSMIGFRNNNISSFAEDILPLTVRWLILTENHITTLPRSLGKLKYLQKLMLSGNQITSLPEELKNCENLELFRISANQLSSLPSWLLELPKLTWFAYAGNPFCAKHPSCDIPLKEIVWEDLMLKETLGEGASGHILRATWKQPGSNREVAVKIFKGKMTSDGLPKEEMDINISLGHHDNLVDVLAKVKNHPEGRDALVLELIPSTYTNLGLPPTFETCTRDTYPEGYLLPFKKIVKILTGIASAGEHMHEKGIMHGDFYAHNIMINDKAECMLGDFGGASYYEPDDLATRAALEQLEVRAFGCLIEEMLMLSQNDTGYSKQKEELKKLKEVCMDVRTTHRPLFKVIHQSMMELEKSV